MNSNILSKIDLTDTFDINFQYCGVLVLLTKIDGEFYFVLQRRAKNISQSGEISFPGGKFDKILDESFMQTALRETEEELGTSAKNIKVYGELNSIISLNGKVIYPFLAELISKSKLKPNKKETEKLIFVPLSFFQKTKVKQYNILLEIKTFEKINGKKKYLFPTSEVGLPKRCNDVWNKKKYPILSINIRILLFGELQPD